MIDLPRFMPVLDAADPALAERVRSLSELTHTAAGPLDAKTRLFISLALDIAAGDQRGAQSLADKARQAGASEVEIRQVLELCVVAAAFQRLTAGVPALTPTAPDTGPATRAPASP
jgi:alkylhydroperoxidase/carboxymuconolactone decarboxylase family protein YurZ